MIKISFLRFLQFPFWAAHLAKDEFLTVSEMLQDSPLIVGDYFRDYFQGMRGNNAL